MLPVDVLPAKKESEFYRAKPTIRNHAQSFTMESEEVPPRKRGQSFMIEDILGDSRNKRLRTHVFETPPPPPCSQCLPSPLDKESASSSSVPTSHSDQHSFVPSPGSSRLVPSTAPLFIGSLSTAPVQSRFGFCYSPAIASSPPFSFSNRSPEVFTFLPSDYSEHMQARCFRQENALRSPLYSPSAILDLSNYVPKSSNARVLQSPVITLQNTTVECPGGRQIIWKHISRNPAKRKGGQIRFTNDQTTTLESTFSEHKYLSSSERKRLATALRLSERQVKTWFQNRRAKWRRIKQEPSNHVSSSESEDCNPSEEPIKIPDCEPTDHRLPAFK